MIQPSSLRSRQVRRWAILAGVGVLGVLMSFGVSRWLSELEFQRLEQSFEAASRVRAGTVIDQMRRPIEQLEALKRLFESVEQPDRMVFKRFSEPMLAQSGVRSYSWYPLVTAANRPAYEREASKLWGMPLSIRTTNATGKLSPSEPRERYFPLLYGVPEQVVRRYAGLDLNSLSADRRASLAAAIASGEIVATDVGELEVDARQKDVMLVIAPIYRADTRPSSPEAREAALRGVVVAVLNVRRLFDAANSGAQGGAFKVSLIHRGTFGSEILADWGGGQSLDGRANTSKLLYLESFSLGRQDLAIEVTATSRWIEENRAHGLSYVLPLGSFLTLLLVLYLHMLLRRSALADRLEVDNVVNVAGRRAAEDWANKLSAAVEQSPASIIITDIEGRIEYVNDRLVETSGYAREELIGETPRLFKSGTTEPALYEELWRTILTGETWQGDLQNRHKDGSLYWEHVMISPIRAGDGRVTHFLGIKEDVTQQRLLLERVQDSEARFRGVLSVITEGLAVISADWVWQYANPVAEEFLGYPPGGLAGKRPVDLEVVRLREDGSVCPPEEYSTRIVLNTGIAVYDKVLGMRYPDGRVRWLNINCSPLGLDASGKVTGAVITYYDITERRYAEEQLKLAQAAINSSGEAIMVADAGLGIQSVNPAFSRVTGYLAADVLGKDTSILYAEHYGETFYVNVLDMVALHGYWQGEVEMNCKGGVLCPGWLGVSSVANEKGKVTHFVFIFSDMTDRMEAQRRIEYLAHHDPLTGLPNRLLLRDRMEQACAFARREQSRVAILFLDLDRFKNINDSLGHPVGDALLCEVVERIKTCVRESDTISRQGGDEFIVVLNDVRDRDAVSRVADKIQQRMSEPFLIDKHVLNTSFSVGIAIFPDDDENFDNLLQKADTAMYHAKETGRNAHRFFTEDLNAKVVANLTLENRLRRAVEQGEFILHYQPQLDLSDGRIVGVEALIRWNHPEEGMIPPSTFIPVAEEAGLIVRLGNWVLNEACRQNRAWQDMGLPPFVIAVNLSAMQFRRLDLVHQVINALVLSDLEAEWLELELTESILIRDTASTIDTLQRMKSLGVKLAVDDFGTGYSSLAYLKRFKVDKLKIDRSFIRDLADDPDDAAIVGAIVQMARSLKLKTIAEGVETEQAAEILRAFCCDEIQGYWLAKPMPADALEAFVRTHLAGQIQANGAG